MRSKQDIRRSLAQFGPGLLYAGAAVGVSHLVQSTRAGAEFGFQLVWVVLLLNIVKYPLFEMGPRYAAATGTTLLDGYRSIGKWAVMLYALVSILTMFFILAAITMVTAGLFHELTALNIDSKLLAILLIAISTIILGIGHYSVLDRLMKVVIIMLSISTLIALIFSFMQPVTQKAEFALSFSFSEPSHVLFLVALLGWMPAPIDIVIWHSVWSVSKNKERGGKIKLPQAMRDFKVGYWGTTVLAVFFLSLGALNMYGTGTNLATGAVSFAGQLIQLYTYNIGEWAFPFIALAAFTTMFSTLLTCLDAFPRTLRKSTKLLVTKLSGRKFHQNLYWSWILLTAVGTSVVILYFNTDMGALVDFATTISFVIAPILAILNYLVLKGSTMPKEFKQPTWLRSSSLISIFVLTGISVWFLLS